MMKISGIIFAGAGALALAACSGGSEPSSEAATDDAAAEAAPAAPDNATPATTQMQAPAATKDPIYGAGGLVEKCLARVNEMTGGNVIGMRNIDEAESGVMVYVNVTGANAPWQCFGSKDGTLQEAYFGGDEGAL